MPPPPHLVPPALWNEQRIARLHFKLLCCRQGGSQAREALQIGRPQVSRRVVGRLVGDGLSLQVRRGGGRHQAQPLAPPHLRKAAVGVAVGR